MAIIDDLEVSSVKVIDLMTELSRELKDALASQDPTRIQGVIDRLDAAVAANPDPHPDPVVEPAPIPDPVI